MSTSLEEHVYLAEKTKMPTKGLNFKATELRLGLPGSESPERVKRVNDDDDGGGNFECSEVKNMVSGAKRGFSVAITSVKGSMVDDNKLKSSNVSVQGSATVISSKAQVVGWPPVRSFRKNSMANNPPKTNDKLESGCHYIKVSMDGAPYLRKVDLNTYGSYVGLSSALEKMFSGFTMGQCNEGLPCPNEGSERSEYVLTYEDKDGDWMLVGDVPWNMFLETCRRLRIMNRSEAVGLTSRTSGG